MNCLQFQADLNSYQDTLSHIESILDTINQTGYLPNNMSAKDLDQLIANNDQQLDEIITNYKPELCEHLKLLGFQYGPEISGFDYHISSIQPISTALDNNQWIVGGSKGMTKILTKNPDGSFEFSADNISGFENNIESIQPFSTASDNNQWIVGGDDGQTKILTQDANGNFTYSSKISGFGKGIRSIQPVNISQDNNQWIVTGDDGQTKILTLCPLENVENNKIKQALLGRKDNFYESETN